MDAFSLQEENRELREALARLQAECTSLRKRNISFVGGGFHAPHRECMCETLRMKLAKLQRARIPEPLEPRPVGVESASQTDAVRDQLAVSEVVATCSKATQVCPEVVEARCGIECGSMTADDACQTETGSVADGGAQTELSSRAQSCQVNLQAQGSDAQVQTETSTRTSAAVQTRCVLQVSVGVDPTPVRCADVATQADDSTAEQRLAALAAAVRESEACVRMAQEEIDSWRLMVHCQAWKHTNITILRPRAECVVNADRVVMERWDPTRLSEEVEREVIPKFTRVFAEVSVAPPNKSEPLPRCKPADIAMREFADAFRRKLASMLQPNEPVHDGAEMSRSLSTASMRGAIAAKTSF